MPFDLTAPLPSVVLYYNCTAVFEAIDPTDGSVVSGVKVISPALYGVNLIAAQPQEDVVAGPFMLVPGPES